MASGMSDGSADREFAPGQSARLCNLVSRPELNGSSVSLLSFHHESGRWAVRTDAGETLRIMPRCLECPSQAQGATEKPGALPELVAQLSGGLLEVRCISGAGRCLVATRPILAGTVLFKEKPFVTMKMHGPNILVGESKRLSEQVKSDPARRALVEELYSGGLLSSTYYDRLDADYQGDAWFRQWSRMWNLNAFSYHHSNRGLFLAGSLFNHSCDPTACYQAVAGQSAAVFRCIQSVPAGGELTVDYTTTTNPSVKARQDQLRREKLFECSCAVCRAPDHSRAIRCQDKECAGYVKPGAAASTAEATRTEWSCDACGRVWPESDLPLALESWLLELAVDHDQQFSSYPHDHFLATLHLCVEVLSPKHWTCFFVASRLLESASSKAGSGVPFMEAQVVALSRFLLAAPTVLKNNAERVELWLTVVKSLRAGGAKRASAVAKAVLHEYAAYWGSDDLDTKMLVGLASGCPHKDQLSEFNFGMIEIEFATVYNVDGNGYRADRARLVALAAELRKAFDSGASPLQTKHIGS